MIWFKFEFLRIEFNRYEPIVYFPFSFFFFSLSSSNASRSAFHKNVLDKKRSGVVLLEKLCQNFSQKYFAPHFYPLATANRGMPHIVMRATEQRNFLSTVIGNFSSSNFYSFFLRFLKFWSDREESMNYFWIYRIDLI